MNPAVKSFDSRSSFRQMCHFCWKQGLYESKSYTCPFVTDENVSILALEIIAGLNQVTIKLCCKVTY